MNPPSLEYLIGCSRTAEVFAWQENPPAAGN
jgi:hypothetical protein